MKGNRGLLIGLAAGIVFAGLVGVIVWLLVTRNAAPRQVPEETAQREVLVRPDNVEEVIAQMEEEAKTPAGTYEVSQNTEWTFPDGKSASTNAYVENGTANTNTVYFTVTLRDTDEIIYDSPYMEVGSVLRDITLTKALPEGTYDAVITYYLVDDDFKDVSHVSMTMRIVVES